MCAWLFYWIYFKILPVKQPEKFGKKYVKIPYEYRNKQYYHLLKTRETSKPITSIVDENGVDVMKYIEPYLGPDLKLGGVELTPCDFGYEKLIITNITDDQIIFEKNEIINF